MLKNIRPLLVIIAIWCSIQNSFFATVSILLQILPLTIFISTQLIDSSMKIINVANFDDFEQLYQDYEKRKNLSELKSPLLLFVSSTDTSTKQYWCSDCREAKPVIEKAIEKFQFNDQLVLAIIDVGPEDDWRKSDNPYRTHKLQINSIPTLISLTTGLRLVESECKEAAKVSHLFSNSM